MKTKDYLRVLSLAVSLTAVGLSWYWFGWEFPLVIMLFIWANNIDRSVNLDERLKIKGTIKGSDIKFMLDKQREGRAKS